MVILRPPLVVFGGLHRPLRQHGIPALARSGCACVADRVLGAAGLGDGLLLGRPGLAHAVLDDVRPCVAEAAEGRSAPRRGPGPAALRAGDPRFFQSTSRPSHLAAAREPFRVHPVMGFEPARRDSRRQAYPGDHVPLARRRGGLRTAQMAS